jgi:N-acetylmuramoyl-L-alanine amidase-like protein
VGSYADGPFKIVHHTTEGSTHAGAKSAFKTHKSDPHLTVAGDDIFQHIDTGLAARALRNPPGGVETNRDSAVQIEVVGFAGSSKDVTTLRSVARLCRWIESEHGVPQAWPNGRPRSSANGKDPGGHNRDAERWDAIAGHYGHSQVPENVHWDPGYTAAELAIVTPDAVFDAHDELAASAVAADRSERDLARPAAERADVVVERVLAAVSALGNTSPVGAPTSITVRVAADGVEVEVTLSGVKDSARTSSRAKRRSRSRTAGPKRRKRNL